ncbi:MAG TPA: hypothetical protein VMW04_00490 [Patescibacteria group bacterium]|nr:hypothetical protein [Patescibacteria group bacterium]
MVTFLVKVRLILTAVLVLLFIFLQSSKINLATADLGRHLKNGEIILQGDPWQIWRTNSYSYTHSDYPFLNHHWGSGIIFFLIWRIAGFVGLSIFFSLITLVTFWLFFRLAWKGSRFSVAWLTAILVLPVLVSRTEIRPEIFSYLFAGVFWWILDNFRQKRLSSRFLFLLPLLMLFWVNLHIYFFLGFFLIGVFFLEELVFVLKKTGGLRDLSYLRNLSIAGGLCLVASFLNPAGLKGLWYPLQIFKGYGYRLFENQTVWFLDKLVNYPPSLYFKIVFGVLVLSWVYAFLAKRKVTHRCFLFSLFFSFMGWTAVRNLTLFGYFAWPIIAGNLREIGRGEKTGERPELEDFMAASLGGLLLLGLFLLNSSYWLARLSLGFGLEKGNEKAAEFFLENHLSGPIFDNYDNGGYLIYYLFPKERVFVDNRPEAYPKEFFEKTYIPMQESEEKWQEVEKEYHFNAIFFYRLDLTPWGQNFLVSRIKDSAWAPVYVDNWSIIFLKRSSQNQTSIQKYELPKEIFSVR